MTDNPMSNTSRGSLSGDDVASMVMQQGSLYCRTCRRALNVEVSLAGSVTLRHSEELRGETVDHPADPVPLTELDNPVMMCDFCSRPDPAWCYETGDQTTESRVVTSRTVGAGDYRRRHQAARTRNVTTAPGRTQQWGQRWSACESCAELIEARDKRAELRLLQPFDACCVSVADGRMSLSGDMRARAANVAVSVSTMLR